MTTFQDPPPQSRRAVRQSERGETPTGPPAQALPYSFDPPSTPPTGAGSLASAPPPTVDPASRVPHVSGRRAQLNPAPERAAVESGVQRPAEDATSAPGYEPLTYVTQGRPQVLGYDQPQATPTEAEQAAFRVRDFSPEGRRAALSREQFQNVTSISSPFAPPAATPVVAPSLHAVPAPADLDYFTQGSPGAVQPTDAAAAAPSTDEVPAVDESGSSDVAETPASDSAFTPVAAAPVAAAPVAAPPVDAAPTVDVALEGSSTPVEVNPDHTLTRRELRELRAAQQAREAAAAAPEAQLPESIDTLLNSGPIKLPTLAPAPGQSQALADAMAEFDSLTRSNRAASAQAAAASLAAPHELSTETTSAPVDAAAPFEVDAPAEAEIATPEPVAASSVASPSEPIVPVASAPVAPAPVASAPVAAVPVAEAPFVSDGLAPPVFTSAPAPASVPAPASAPVPNIAPPAGWAAPTAPSVPAPALVEPPREPTIADGVTPLFLEPEPTAPVTRPTGHWSLQADLDDDELPENTITRGMGASSLPVTTSALVLPSVPAASDMMSPFNATGEILVTGSIDLPHSLSATGAHPHRVDNSDFEDDPLDSQVSSTDSAPVRAIRAVSTHTSTRGMIDNKKKPSNNSRTITAMIVVVAVLALTVGGLVAYMVIHGL